MGLLRSLADAVLVGAGTFRSSRQSSWRPDNVAPSAAASFAQLRRRLGLAAAPTTVILTGRGDLDPAHPALRSPRDPVVIVGPAGTEARLRAAGLATSIPVADVAGSGAVHPADVLRVLERLGHRLVLTEGGPHLLGSFLREGLLDELFLTVAPQLAGRRDGTNDPLALVEGASLWPDRPTWAELVSLRRAGSHLFLRYRLEESQP
jgi:riboflavin biosynthesis pyrimidine reductase